MTKCSFVCMIRRNGDKFELVMREVTYSSPELKESAVEYKFEMGGQDQV